MMRFVFRSLSGLFALLSKVLASWPWLALALVVATGTGPAMRWEYSYNQAYNKRLYTGCIYLTVRGFVSWPGDGGCPFIVVMTEDGKRLL